MSVASNRAVAALAADDDSAERQRAQQVAAAGRRRKLAINLAIRFVSVVSVLVLW